MKINFSLIFIFTTIAECLAQFNVKNYGAIGNGIIDDRVAIQKAIDAANQAGGGEVFFPEGTYLISPNPDISTYKTCLVVYKNIYLKGTDKAKSTIKLKNNVGNYDAMIGANPSWGNLSGFKVSDITIDGNGSNNDINSEQDFNNAMRYCIRIYVATGISIKQCVFTDMLNVNTITCNSSTNCKNVEIINNEFTNHGGIKVDFDHSSIYTNCDSAIVSNNILKSRKGAGTIGVRAAIEIHGARQYIYNNTIDGYWIGINVTANARINSVKQRYFNNKITNVATGFLVWSDKFEENTNPILKDVVLYKNSIGIDIDNWRGYYNGIPRAGFAFEPNRDGDIADFFVIENNIKFTNASAGKAIYNDYFAGMVSIIKHLNTSAKITNLNIIQNTVEDSPGNGIYIGSVIDKALISGNYFNRCGKSAASINNRDKSAVRIDNYSTSNIQVSCNTIADEQDNKTTKYVLYDDAINSGNNYYFNNNKTGGLNCPDYFKGSKSSGAEWKDTPDNSIGFAQTELSASVLDGNLTFQTTRTNISFNSLVKYSALNNQPSISSDFVLATNNITINTPDQATRISIDLKPWQISNKNSYKMFLHTSTNAQIGCGNSVNISINNLTELLDQNHIDKITIYPNPTTDKLYLNNLLSQSTITISDMTGKSLISVKTQNTSETIDISSLEAGVYIVKVGEVIKKINVQ